MSRFLPTLFARRTHIHACTPTYIYRDTGPTYILANMQEFIHKNKPPTIPSTADNGKMVFIYSGYFHSASLSPLLLRGTPGQSNGYCRNLHAEALQATVSEGLAQGQRLVWDSNPRPSGPKA